MSGATPSIPLFGDAYLADTRHLSLEEHGAYLQLMMIAWRVDGCCLPDDDARLALMLGCTAAKWKKLKPAIMAFWSLKNGVWIQARLSKERKFVEEKRAKNKASADYRWNGQAVENKHFDQCERISERNAPPPPEEEEEVRASLSLRNAFPKPGWADPQIWADFLTNRRGRRMKNTATAYRRFLADISRLADDEWPPGRLLEHAVAHGWAGIYDPKENRNGRTNGMGRNQPGDGLSSTTRAAAAVFGTAPARQPRDVPG